MSVHPSDIQRYLNAWYPLQGSGKGTPASDALSHHLRIYPDISMQIKYCLTDFEDVGFVHGEKAGTDAIGFLAFKMYHHKNATLSGLACYRVAIDGTLQCALDTPEIIGNPGVCFLRKLLRPTRKIDIHFSPFEAIAAHVEFIGTGVPTSDHIVFFGGIRLPASLGEYTRARLHGAEAAYGLQTVLMKIWPRTEVSTREAQSFERLPAKVRENGWDKTLYHCGHHINPVARPYAP